jgi:ethanolamine utilization protein EutN
MSLNQVARCAWTYRKAGRLTARPRRITLAAMYLGIVKGTVVAERKVAGLEGKKLLLVQPVDEHGAAVGELQAAVDTVQAGDGDLVYLVGSREAALACDPWFVPRSSGSSTASTCRPGRPR